MAFSTFNSGQPLYGQGSTTGYTALGDRQFIKATAVTAGVRQIKTPVANVKQGDLAVQSTGAANGSINILAGDCWVAGSTGYGFYYAYNDATITQAITATATIRTDVIYVAITDTGAANPTVTLGYGAGTAVPANTATACYLPLASIAVPAGFSASSTVTDVSITDTRKKAQLMDFSVASTSSVGAASTGNLIYDTSSSAVKAYNGAAWDTLMQSTNTGVVDNATGNYRYVGTVMSTSANTPVSPQTGMVWYQTDTGIYYVYTGSAWQQVLSQSAYTSNASGITVTQLAAITQTTYVMRYTRVGRTITGNFHFVAGSAGTAANNVVITFTTSSTLPTPANNMPTPYYTTIPIIAGNHWFSPSAGTHYAGDLVITAASPLTMQLVVSGQTPNTYLGGAGPSVAIGIGTIIKGQFSYEAAS